MNKIQFNSLISLAKEKNVLFYLSILNSSNGAFQVLMQRVFINISYHINE